MLPALLVVLFAGVITLLALPLGEKHHTYALQVVEGLTKLAAILVGAQAAHHGLDAEPRRPQLPVRTLPSLILDESQGGRALTQFPPAPQCGLRQLPAPANDYRPEHAGSHATTRVDRPIPEEIPSLLGHKAQPP